MLPLVLSLGAPAPVLGVPSPPVPREVGFGGFNLVPLKASVLPGEGPWFAVLVADSGPTDRDWSNPLLPQGRAGKDFALWLQGQGLGSLRYDKRFLGSKDPGLDISLDAQVGDVRAALRAARALPEAKGKKLLLVGHGEGALLALMGGQEADALLLLGLPAQSMAGTIAAQIRLQLPESTAAANLAYLDRVFEAIRQRKGTPEGGPDIYPRLVGLARQLMRPESLDFVRSTLDLDPWAMAARVTVPCAAAWGDRDVQTARPARIPEGFPGRIIDLPEANHLLRRETRLRGGLDGSSAVSTYGSDTPMADLGPLAAWLKTLK